jgi:hypothetical protein
MYYLNTAVLKFYVSFEPLSFCEKESFFGDIRYPVGKLVFHNHFAYLLVKKTALLSRAVEVFSLCRLGATRP